MELVHGSAGWMYRLIVESLLGLSRENDRLRFAPCLPADWADVTIRYAFVESVYEIVIRQVVAGAGEQIGVTSVAVDGALQSEHSVLLIDDRARHVVEVTMGIPRSRADNPQRARRNANVCAGEQTRAWRGRNLLLALTFPWSGEERT
jgi:hypothetical protein